MKKKNFIILITGSIILLLIFSFKILHYRYQERKHLEEQEYHAGFEELIQIRDELIQIKYNELIEFAKNNINSIDNVCQTIFAKMDDYDYLKYELYDYEKIMAGESDEIKNDFDIVFNNLNLAFNYIQIEDYIYYKYDYVDSTSIDLFYIWEDSSAKEAILSSCKQYGDIEKITDNIYVLYYDIPSS